MASFDNERLFEKERKGNNNDNKQCAHTSIQLECLSVLLLNACNHLQFNPFIIQKGFQLDCIKVIHSTMQQAILSVYSHIQPISVVPINFPFLSGLIAAPIACRPTLIPV